MGFTGRVVQFSLSALRWIFIGSERTVPFGCLDHVPPHSSLAGSIRTPADVFQSGYSLICNSLIKFSRVLEAVTGAVEYRGFIEECFLTDSLACSRTFV